MGDVVAHLKPQKNHRFVIFVMYFIVTTVPVAFFWARSNDTVRGPSNIRLGVGLWMD